jgi:hypothetical protein
MTTPPNPPDYKTVFDLYKSAGEWITRENAQRLFYRQASAGDGNCLFNSLSISLWDSYAVNASPGDIRQGVCNYYKAAVAEINKIANNIPPATYANDNEQTVKVQAAVLEHIEKCIASDGVAVNKELTPYLVATRITLVWTSSGMEPNEMNRMNKICNDKEHCEYPDINASTIVIGCNIVVLSVEKHRQAPGIFTTLFDDVFKVIRCKLYDDDSPPLFVILTGYSGGGASGHYDCLIPKDNTTNRKGLPDGNFTLPDGSAREIKHIDPMKGGASTLWPTHIQPILRSAGRRRVVPWA